MTAILNGGPLDGMELTVHAADKQIAIPANKDMQFFIGATSTPEVKETWERALRDANVAPESVFIYDLEEQETQEEAEAVGWHGVQRLFYRYREARRSEK